MLNPGLVRPLIDSSTTDATKAQALMNFALTLCHEMMHAFDRLRNMTRPADEELLDEPFYQQPGTNPEDSAWVSEVGMAWEQAMIGGFMTDSPRRKSTWGSGGLLAFVADFPNYIISKSYGNGVDVANHENDIWFGYVFPAFLAQAYGSEEFWSIHVARYGLPALRVPKLAVTPINRFQHGAPTICQLGHAVQEYHPQLIQLGQDLKYRDAAWRMIRPWYQHHFNEWSLSPYCHTGLRNHPEKFRLAHRQGDELAAQEAFQSLGAFEYWEGKFVVTGCVLSQSSYWIDEAIGYLMMTIMPIRTQELMISVPNFARNEWTPSLEATRDATAQSQRPIEVDFTQYNDLHETFLRPRNVAFAPGSNRGTRASLLMILKSEIPNRQNQFPLPDPVYQAVKAMFDNVERNAPQFESTDMWLPLQVNFVLPPWHTAQAQTNVGYGPATPYAPYNPTAQPQQHVPGAPAPSTPSSGSGTPSFHSASSSLVGTPNQSPGGSPPGPVSAPRRAANSARRAANAPDEVYFTAGEVGNHRSSGDLWVIVDDGARGYDVYDATDVVEEMWADDIAAFNLDDHCEATLLGLKARPNLKQDLLAQGERRGKLIQPMRQQDIRERDGRNGKPFWISIGNDVFDISNYKFANPNEQNVCTMRPGGNPWNAVVNDGTIDYDQLLLDFKPYKCATIASKVPNKGPGPMEEFHFTTKEVAWHVYPESTMYTIIRGQVYNLTGYMDFHPGGTTILQKWAGKDSTLEFESYHEDHDRCLADYDYLRVGRVVEEKQMYQLTDKEVVLNGHIYNVSGLGTGKAERELLADIDRYGLQRKDITPVLNDSWKPPPSLSLLVQRPDLITGKLAPPLREIDMDALHTNNGGHIPHADDIKVPRDRVEADLQMPLWVCYRALVYDMTTVYKYGPEDIRAELNKFNGRYKGSVIPRTALAARLQEEYSCRVIGRLVRDTPRRRGIIVSDSDGDDRPVRRRRLS
ncbi:cytochrome b5-like Heme/Steroid binding domain-containing protein [Diaporthe amygdali]|uniref:cytochrome b5-like Heme/Steroid binding domain-containing protein n=1 Tax=Phomopsis amygdali TaxID=1214568 RepID=UPI0022FF027E|nr:cytochrome b5-like Heme/Steroid binding domain-containing protein [Diaporthe amygdali]KAJ0110145.1 cytochrome b5-like Heme/Steroid binding domain-containing protein [Diaporthe amygdali]